MRTKTTNGSLITVCLICIILILFTVSSESASIKHEIQFEMIHQFFVAAERFTSIGVSLPDLNSSNIILSKPEHDWKLIVQGNRNVEFTYRHVQVSNLY